MSEEASGMRALIGAVAGPRQWSDTRESWLNRAARRSNLTYRTIKAIWYGEISDAGNRSIRLLQHAAKQRANALSGRLEEIARGMESTDAHLYRQDISALISAVRALRGVDCPGDDYEG